MTLLLFGRLTRSVASYGRTARRTWCVTRGVKNNAIYVWRPTSMPDQVLSAMPSKPSTEDGCDIDLSGR